MENIYIDSIDLSANVGSQPTDPILAMEGLSDIVNKLTTIYERNLGQYGLKGSIEYLFGGDYKILPSGHLQSLINSADGKKLSGVVMVTPQYQKTHSLELTRELTAVLDSVSDIGTRLLDPINDWLGLAGAPGDDYKRLWRDRIKFTDVKKAEKGLSKHFNKEGKSSDEYSNMEFGDLYGTPVGFEKTGQAMYELGERIKNVDIDAILEKEEATLELTRALAKNKDLSECPKPTSKKLIETMQQIGMEMELLSKALFMSRGLISSFQRNQEILIDEF